MLNTTLDDSRIPWYFEFTREGFMPPSTRISTIAFSLLLTVCLHNGCTQGSADDDDVSDANDAYNDVTGPPPNTSNLAETCGRTTGFGPPVSSAEYEVKAFGYEFLSPSFHLGTDFMLGAGTEIRAGVTGQIVWYSGECRTEEEGGYGELYVGIGVELYPGIAVESGDGDEEVVTGYTMIYGHLRAYDGAESTGLSVGDCVTPDTVIAYVNNNGCNGCCGEHLHYGVRLQSSDDAYATDGGLWLRGNDDDAGAHKQYFTDPIGFVDRTFSIPEWAAEAVDDLYSQGIIGVGLSWDEYLESLTDRLVWNRAEMAYLLAHALELENSEVWGQCVAPFADIPEDAWYIDEVTTLAWLEYDDEVTPFDRDGMFNPDRGYTRAELLKVLIEAWGIEKVDSGASFNDLDDAPEALRTYIHTGVAEGIITDQNAEYRPNHAATMAEAAVMIDRVIDSFGRNTPEASDFSDDPDSNCQGEW